MARHSPLEVVTGAAVLVAAGGFLVFAMVNTGQASSHGGYVLHAAFDHADGLSPGADVRIAGVKVGGVQSMVLNPKTYQAEVAFSVQNDVPLTTDSSATISSDGLLGGKYLELASGGDEKTLKDGGTVTITQGSVSIEALIGKYIFGGTGSGKSSGGDTAGAGAKPAAPAQGSGGKSVIPPLK